MPPMTGLLRDFHDALPPDLAGLAAGLVGKDRRIDGPFGPQRMIYADYVASGRALMPVEAFVLDEVLPFYANSHTEASFCGGFVTRLRREARAVVAACCGASADHATIFCGSGATAGINRLVHLLDAGAPRTRVILGPYEHHSNILPWRESGAEIVEIAEGAEGGPDMAALRDALAAGGADRIICSLSAASNVTGIVADVAGITRVVKDAGAAMVWDYAGAGPYLPVRMTPAAGAEIDAVVISPHKFVGGPAASGVLVLRRDAVRRDAPTWAGGGTVRFVSPAGHDYCGALEAREEAGTPNVIGDIRAALAFLVKERIGAARMSARNDDLARRGLDALGAADGVEVLGRTDAARLPILSFRVRTPDGRPVHQQLATRLLSDAFGIQARGGCACAGPYVHRLLDIDAAQSDAIRRAILGGDEMAKPGFVRLNLSVLLPDDDVDFILDSVAGLGRVAALHAGKYGVDPARAIFRPNAVAAG